MKPIVQLYGHIYNEYMKSNNKKRLLKLIEILKKNTDMDHKLSLNEIATLLEEDNIVIRREYLSKLQRQAKLYEDTDIRVLSEPEFYYGPELPF